MLCPFTVNMESEYSLAFTIPSWCTGDNSLSVNIAFISSLFNALARSVAENPVDLRILEGLHVEKEVSLVATP